MHQGPLSRKYPFGLTAIELMVAITIVIVVIVAGIPSYITFQKNNAASALADALGSAMRQARVEAANRGVPVVVCATDASFSSCTNQTAWIAWAVFADLNDNQTLDSGELLNTYSISGNNSVEASTGLVIYEPTGFARATTFFTMQPEGCSRGKALNVQLNGSFSTSTIGCP